MRRRTWAGEAGCSRPTVRELAARRQPEGVEAAECAGVAEAGGERPQARGEGGTQIANPGMPLHDPGQTGFRPYHLTPTVQQRRLAEDLATGMLALSNRLQVKDETLEPRDMSLKLGRWAVMTDDHRPSSGS